MLLDDHPNSRRWATPIGSRAVFAENIQKRSIVWFSKGGLLDQSMLITYSFPQKQKHTWGILWFLGVLVAAINFRTQLDSLHRTERGISDLLICETGWA